MEGLEVRAGSRIGGIFTLECYRKGRLIWTDISKNIVTNEGLNHLLDVVLHGKTLISPFYCVLSESDTSAAAGMTYATPVFTETTSYDEATRPEYEEAASSSQSITNSANKATFTISATKTIYGAALMGGSSTKSDSTSASTHVLYCYSKLSTSRAMLDNDVINLTYVAPAADDA